MSELTHRMNHLGLGAAIHQSHPMYGRYEPHADDFKVESHFVMSNTSEARRYWESVLRKCTESRRIYTGDERGRDVFAYGSVIIKTGHLHISEERDYSYADANEVKAIELASRVLVGVKVPQVYFSGKLRGRQVLVLERLKGRSLTVAWPSLTQSEKRSFKNQAREMLRELRYILPVDGRTNNSHVVPDPYIDTSGRIQTREMELLFKPEHYPDMGFMHNNFTRGNLIVKDGRIVGVAGWEMAGYFGWRRAAEVHRRIRSPQAGDHSRALSQEMVRDIMFWNDLYDE
ncbi:Fc.00g034910.m01.CDS01 [Cosmosporella sp. VM-42]